MSKVAWPELMRLGMVELRLRPEDFWDLTPAELVFLAGGGQAQSASLTRSKLDELMARFPDAPKGDSVNG